MLESAVVQSIAKELGKTPAQVCLAWNLQKGNAVVFKSLCAERVRENVGAAAVRLSAAQEAQLDALTTAEAVAEAQCHWEQRRGGTPAPWGPGLRPRRQVTAP